jgi:hypothetical protein
MKLIGFGGEENILNHLYTSKSLKWLDKVDDSDVQPYVIQRWLCMNDQIRKQTRWLDKYVFSLQNNPKMYLSLAWSIIPKSDKMPFCRYIKEEKPDEEFDFIICKIRKQFYLSDNDMFYLKDILIKNIKDDMIKWFSYYGVLRKYWSKYRLNYQKLKEYKVDRSDKLQKGLSAWGM